MSIGKKIKQMRELRNYTQSYMALQLDMSVQGYGKIERDETDITLTKIKKIAEILDTTMPSILEFDSTQVFNQYNNKIANANGVVHNQQINSDLDIDQEILELKRQVSLINSKLNEK